MSSLAKSPADHLPDMSAPVTHGALTFGAEVHRDAWGIPHIRSDNLYDLFFAQGFATAQDRLWQMDYDRMRCLGRAGEYLGESVKTQDILMRRRNFESVSRADYDICSPDAKTALYAYADGVNAFIDGDDPLPFEYALLETEPERWEPWHCIVVYKVRNSAEGGFQSKLWQTNMVRRVGAERAATYMTGYSPGMLMTVPPSIEFDGEVMNVVNELHAIIAACEHLQEIDFGSNGWAISGELTNTGLPMVGGDSHRALEMPNVYYQTHLTHPEFDVIGHSIPGMPLVMHFAHNQHVAWGMTHGGCDTQDLFVEQLRRVDGGVQYLYEDEWLDAEVGEESFRFVGNLGPTEDVAEVVRTHHGPVITGGPDAGWGVALADPGSEDATPWVDSALAVMKCRNADQFEAALAGWTDRVNNYPYADIYGDFGYCLKGRVPMRTFVNAFGPVPGWTGEHEWQDYIPPHQMPRIRNPETGWVVTCNQRVVGDDYPFWLAASFGPDYRARRIITHIQRHINEGQAIAAEDMREFHADTVSVTALQFKVWLDSKQLSGVEDVPPEFKDAHEEYLATIELLRNWDGRMDRDSEAALIWADINEHIALEILADLYQIDETAVLDDPAVFAPAYDHYRKNIKPNYMLVLSIVDSLSEEDFKNHPAEVAETAIAKALIRRGLRKMSQWLDGADDKTPTTWGDWHGAAQKHALTQHRPKTFEARASQLDPPEISVAGHEDVPLATGGSRGALFKPALSGPVNRYLHDPSDWSNSRWIVPLGASGNSGSPHFADQQQRWADVDYIPQLYDWDDIAQATESVQRFSPPR